MTAALELPADFSRSTVPDLADLWGSLNNEIAALRKSRDAIADLLLAVSAADHNGADEPFRLGAIIAGEKVKVQAVWRLTEGGEHPKWAPHLQYVRSEQ